MISFYAEDVVLELPSAAPQSPAGIKKHYQELHSRVDEWLRIDWLMLGEDKIAVEIYTEFLAKQAHPQFSLKPLEQGELFRCTNMVHYDLNPDGSFALIRVGRYKVHPGQVSERPAPGG
jgi:hypothetical protein